jgi:hypothetical protein
MRRTSTSRRSRLLHGKRGQAMMEYALITGTVILGFAMASQLGASDAFIKLVSGGGNVSTGNGSVQDSYNILLPDTTKDIASEIHNNAAKFNTQIQLQ